jgi:hypothetical protein
MGVTIHRNVPFQSLVDNLQQLLTDQNLLDIPATMHSTGFFQSAGDRAFPSRVCSSSRLVKH